MFYFPELYYFFDQKDFPLQKAVFVTAKEIAKYCTYYKAKLIVPQKGIKEKERQGLLPVEEKDKFIEELMEWMFSNSLNLGLFTLTLDNLEIGKAKEEVAKFDHHDDTCCWVLNLSEDEFFKLQNVWKENGLPEDLFYLEDKAIKVIIPDGFIGSFLARLGFTGETSKIYSPKRWEEKKEKNYK